MSSPEVQDMGCHHGQDSEADSMSSPEVQDKAATMGRRVRQIACHHLRYRRWAATIGRIVRQKKHSVAARFTTNHVEALRIFWEEGSATIVSRLPGGNRYTIRFSTVCSVR